MQAQHNIFKDCEPANFAAIVRSPLNGDVQSRQSLNLALICVSDESLKTGIHFHRRIGQSDLTKGWTLLEIVPAIPSTVEAPVWDRAHIKDYHDRSARMAEAVKEAISRHA